MLQIRQVRIFSASILHLRTFAPAPLPRILPVTIHPHAAPPQARILPNAIYLRRQSNRFQILQANWLFPISRFFSGSGDGGGDIFFGSDLPDTQWWRQNSAAQGLVATINTLQAALLQHAKL